MNTHELRVCIVAALRNRDPRTVALMLGSGETAALAASISATPDEEVAALADLIGLDANGNDPRERLAAQSAMLTSIANALLGNPKPGASHSHHSLDLRVRTMVGEHRAACDGADASARRNADLRAEVEGLTRELAEARKALAGGAEPTLAEIEAASAESGESFWLCTLSGLGLPFCVRITVDGAAWFELDGGEPEPLAQGLACVPDGRWWRLVNGVPVPRSAGGAT